MKEFFESTTFIISFLVMIIFINMGLGREFTDIFLMLVLFSMIILQADKFITFIEGSFKV